LTGENSRVERIFSNGVTDEIDELEVRYAGSTAEDEVRILESVASRGESGRTRNELEIGSLECDIERSHLKERVEDDYSEWIAKSA